MKAEHLTGSYQVRPLMTLQEHDSIIRTAAAIGAVAPRRQIAVAGKDHATYLHGLLTNDIQGLSPGTGCYAAWLTPQGRMLTDMHVLESGSMILLDLPAETVDATLARLDQFVFTEDVRLESLAETLSAVWVHGPRAAAAIEDALHLSSRPLSAWQQYQHATFEFGGELAPSNVEGTVSIARIDQLGVPGYCIYVARAREAALLAALNAAGAVVVLPDAIEAARIEAGYPVFGLDMTDDTIPLEAGIEDRAISMTKGCYVGQEVIVRVLHRGHGRVARKLVGLRIDGTLPLRGARLSAGDREIGSITSAARSPRLGAIALGYVHRDFVDAGTQVSVETPDGVATATVTERLIPSAP
jgi:folate-binding protein YgfZ